MNLYHVLAGSTLAVVAVLHTVLGEHAILRPLFADRRWDVGMARWAVQRVLRFAWHATTIAWLALAATAFGVDGPIALTATALVTGVLIVVMLPAHLAWPLFLLAALWGAVATEVVGSALLGALALGAVVVAGAAAFVHVAWATGRAAASMASAVPMRPDGSPLFSPSPATTLLVAVALTAYGAGLTALVLEPTAVLARVIVVGATVVLAIRAVGDGRYVGFSKKVRSTPFSRRDDAIYTPVVAALTIGGAAALAL